MVSSYFWYFAQTQAHALPDTFQNKTHTHTHTHTLTNCYKFSHKQIVPDAAQSPRPNLQKECLIAPTTRSHDLCLAGRNLTRCKQASKQTSCVGLIKTVAPSPRYLASLPPHFWASCDYDRPLGDSVACRNALIHSDVGIFMLPLQWRSQRSCSSRANVSPCDEMRNVKC